MITGKHFLIIAIIVMVSTMNGSVLTDLFDTDRIYGKLFTDPTTLTRLFDFQMQFSKQIKFMVDNKDLTTIPSLVIIDILR